MTHLNMTKLPDRKPDFEYKGYDGWYIEITTPPYFVLKKNLACGKHEVICPGNARDGISKETILDEIYDSAERQCTKHKHDTDN